MTLKVIQMLTLLVMVCRRTLEVMGEAPWAMPMVLFKPIGHHGDSKEGLQLLQRCQREPKGDQKEPKQPIR